MTARTTESNKLLNFLKSDKILFLYNLFWIIYWIYISRNIPYLSDDWNWGSGDGLKQFFGMSVNSRICGNALALVLCRFPILKTLIIGISIWLYIYLCVKFVNLVCVNSANYIFSHLIISLLFFTINHELWSQTFGWVSGFCNYVTSSICLILYLIIVFELFSNKRISVLNNRFLTCILLFLFSVSKMLFLENIAALFLGTTVLLTVLNIKKIKDVLFELIAVFAGEAVGFFLMFFNKIYLDLFASGSMIGGMGDRAFTFTPYDNLGDKISALIKNLIFVYVEVFEYNYVLILVLMVVSVIVFYVYKKKQLNDFSFAKKIIYLLLFSLAGLSVFVFVQVWGPRIYIHLFTVLLISVCILADKIYVLVSDFCIKNGKKVLCLLYIFPVLGVLALGAIYVKDYAYIGKTEKRIIKEIENYNSSDEETLYLPRYKDKISQKYLWRANDFNNEYLEYYFKEFYNISEDTEIIFYD